MQQFWNFCARHRIELISAILFAAVFAVIVDFLQPASWLRAALRHFKNKLAERSAASLRARIAAQERYRDRLAAFLASDKALYLATLQYILGILLLVCMGAAVFLIGLLMPAPAQFDVLALAPIILAIVMAVYGIRMASWDSRPKIFEVIAKVDVEIAEMKAKLNARMS